MSLPGDRSIYSWRPSAQRALRRLHVPRVRVSESPILWVVTGKTQYVTLHQSPPSHEAITG